jgi:MFS family permease
VNRFGTSRIIAVTMAVMAVGYLLFLRLDTSPSYLTMLLPALVLIGVGWIGFPANNIQATAGVDDDEQGLAAGVLQTSMQVGAAVVLAVTTAMIASGVDTATSPEAMLATFRPGLVFAAAVAVVGALVAALALVPRRTTPTADQLDPDPAAEPDYAPPDTVEAAPAALARRTVTVMGTARVARRSCRRLPSYDRCDDEARAS